MTNGVPNPEPDEKERSKDPILYSKVQLLTKYRIFDKYLTDEDGNEVGGYVDVGCVDSWKGDEPIAYRCFVTGSNPSNPKAAMASRFQGKFELKAGVVKEEELYEILWLSPQREGSPCADPSVETIFKIIDEKAEVTSSVAKFDQLKKVIDILDKIKPEEARQVFAALNYPNYQDDGVVLAKIKDFGKNNYELFLKTYNAPSTPVKSILKEALDLGVISHEPASGHLKLGKELITTFKISDTAELTETFSNWIQTAENGQDVFNNIKKQLSSAKGAKA